MSVEPIPLPEVLDPDRPGSDASGDSPRSGDDSGDAHSKALQASCDYGQQLWHTLDSLRAYLVSSLPANTQEPGAEGRTAGGARPNGPQDARGWQDWEQAYAAVTSVLAGPRGDSGYGVGEARRESQSRRADGPLVREADATPMPADTSDAPTDGLANGAANHEPVSRGPHHRVAVRGREKTIAAVAATAGLLFGGMANRALDKLVARLSGSKHT